MATPPCYQAKTTTLNIITLLKKPILILQGDPDLQVPESDAQLLHQSAKGSKLAIIKGMNHVLKNVKGVVNQQAASYSDPKLPINQELIKAIDSFVKQLP